MSPTDARNEGAVEIYTDGGAAPNPGPGGWGAVVLQDGAVVEELSGGEPDTTNNRMELTAAIRALESRPAGSAVILHTDSTYVRSGITNWIHGWIRNNWRRGPKRDQPVLNEDLWRQLHALASERDVDWRWLKGHAGHEHNERADALATAAIAARGGDTGPSAAAVEERFDAAHTQALIKVRAAAGRATWIVLVMESGDQRQLDGHERDCTANRAELLAGLELLRAVPPERSLGIRCGDYLARGVTEWLPAWKARGWQTAGGDPVRNADLWRRLDAELGRRSLDFAPLPRKGPLLGELKRRLREVGS